MDQVQKAVISVFMLFVFTYVVFDIKFIFGFVFGLYMSDNTNTINEIVKKICELIKNIIDPEYLSRLINK